MVYFFSFSASYITFIFKPFDMVSHLNWINLSFVYISVLWPLQFFDHFFHYSTTSTWNCLWHTVCAQYSVSVEWMNQKHSLPSPTFLSSVILLLKMLFLRPLVMTLHLATKLSLGFLYSYFRVLGHIFCHHLNGDDTHFCFCLPKLHDYISSTPLLSFFF